MPTPIFLHLVSHASGELLEMLARNVVVTLVYAAHDEAHNDAVVLQALLSGE